MPQPPYPGLPTAPSQAYHHHHPSSVPGAHAYLPQGYPPGSAAAQPYPGVASSAQAYLGVPVSQPYTTLAGAHHHQLYSQPYPGGLVASAQSAAYPPTISQAYPGATAVSQAYHNAAYSGVTSSSAYPTTTSSVYSSSPYLAPSAPYHQAAAYTHQPHNLSSAAK